jgi:hypothetical protein
VIYGEHLLPFWGTRILKDTGYPHDQYPVKILDLSFKLTSSGRSIVPCYCWNSMLWCGPFRESTGSLQVDSSRLCPISFLLTDPAVYHGWVLIKSYMQRWPCAKSCKFYWHTKCVSGYHNLYIRNLYYSISYTTQWSSSLLGGAGRLELKTRSCSY